jgi:amino acid transporter
MQPLFAQGDDLAGAVLSTLAVLAIVPYFLMGFETIPKCAEEASTRFDTRGFSRIMLLALAAATLFYVAVIAVVSMLHPWQQLSKKEFATAIAFEQAFSVWLVRLMLFGAVLSLLKVFNGMFLVSTRLLYAMGRRDLLGGGLGAVHEGYGTPKVAIVLVGAITLLAVFLGRAVLGPIATVGSLAGALGWLATCLALAGGAGGRERGALAVGLLGAAVSLALAVVVTLSFRWYHWLAVWVWALLGLVLWGRRK